jgi:hypothetical protein
MLQVTDVDYVDEFKVRVSFNTGERGVVDLRDALWGPVFEPLKDPNAFRRFKVSNVLHTIAWENGADFAPEFLYDQMVKQSTADSRA